MCASDTSRQTVSPAVPPVPVGPDTAILAVHAPEVGWGALWQPGLPMFPANTPPSQPPAAQPYAPQLRFQPAAYGQIDAAKAAPCAPQPAHAGGAAYATHGIPAGLPAGAWSGLGGVARPPGDPPQPPPPPLWSSATQAAAIGGEVPPKPVLELEQLQAMDRLGLQSFAQLRALIMAQQQEYRCQVHILQWLLLQRSVLETHASSTGVHLPCQCFAVCTCLANVLQ